MSEEARDLIHSATHDLSYRILEALEGEMTSRQVADAVGEEQDKVLYRLKVLADKGLINKEKAEGYSRRYIFSRLDFAGSITVMDNEVEATASITQTTHT